jgi:tungstate transport system ATP-binding protein
MSTRCYHLAGVEARYQDKSALIVDELAFRAGQLNVVAGLNGSGKSTLLNVLAFLKQPSHGVVEFSAEPVTWERTQLRKLRRSVTLVQQAPYLFRGSVGMNIAFGAKARGLGGEALRKRVKESLESVGLYGFEERNANGLSGGEARRVALARALACDPEVILLDEPLAYVDELSTTLIENLVVTLVDRGVLVIVSSHDSTLGTRLKGRTIRLFGGRLMHELEQHEVYVGGETSESSAYAIV